MVNGFFRISCNSADEVKGLLGRMPPAFWVSSGLDGTMPIGETGQRLSM